MTKFTYVDAKRALRLIDEALDVVNSVVVSTVEEKFIRDNIGLDALAVELQITELYKIINGNDLP